MMNRTGLLSLFLALLLSGLFSCAVLAAPQAELWPRWQAHNPASAERIDHRAWGTFIGSYLVPGQNGGPNLLRYAAVTRSDRKRLESYLDALSRVAVTQLKRAEQQAYWINLYNALTVNTVLEHYPISSIRKIRSGLFSPGPWDLTLIEVEGVELSLNDIEHASCGRSGGTTGSTMRSIVPAWAVPTCSRSPSRPPTANPYWNGRRVPMSTAHEA